MTDTDITYRTITRKNRTGPVGRLLTIVADHPMRTGILCGLAVVLIAALRASDGVTQEPFFALILSAVVIFTWTALFSLMGPFFRLQTYFDVEVTRQIQLHEGNFVWLEQGQVIKALSNPTFRLYTNPLPSEMTGGAKKLDLPWPVWLVLESDEGRFVIETKITAGEAAQYDAVPDQVASGVDEQLPVQVASPLLMLART
jgi:hypothetical protein